MKALTGPSMYPGTTFGLRFLLCVALFLSSVHGNTHQQDVHRTWKNFSKILLSANAHGENDDQAISSSHNGSAKLPLLLDENNIMHADHSLANEDDDVTYSDEYEQEPHRPPAELKTMLRLTNQQNSTVSTTLAESSSATDQDNDFSEYPVVDPNYEEQYDAYYYYEDYDNETKLEHPVESPNDTSSELTDSDFTTAKSTYPSTDDSTYHSTSSDKFEDSDLDDGDYGTSMEGSNKHYVVTSNHSSKLPDKSILIAEAVVSVVTTKSVVNGTFSVPVTPLPRTTEQISSPPSSSEFMNSKHLERHHTTENSIVLASVQTSRSISGARFLPYPVVEQVEQVAQNVNGNNKVPNQSESTESIIDKLDRVQSGLYNGFLTSSFKNSGNTLQLDVLQETEQTKKSKTTTTRTPTITKFVPGRISATRKPITSVSPIVPIITKFSRTETRLNNTHTATAKNISSKISQQHPSTDKTSANPGGKENNGKPKSIVVQDVSAFLPPGFDLAKAKSEPTEKSILDDILSKATVDVSAFLPPGFQNKPKIESGQEKNEQLPVQDIFKKSQVDVSSFLPPGYKPKPSTDDVSNTTSKQSRLDDLFSASKVDISSLLPPGYNPKTSSGSSQPSNDGNDVKNLTGQVSATTQATPSTTKSGGLKIVFPSRPGGRKPINRITTPSSHQAPGAFKPAIQKGWPTRATTEFTGWPTSSTTPISIEKLLEAARTATAQLDNMPSTPVASMTSTSTTTTTTTTTPRPTTPGTCEEECELAGTIRLVGNTAWVPELLDSNTIEWKQLADKVESEIESAFTKSSTLRKWYKSIRIDAFSQGSILVDYFVELNDIGKKIDTQELKSIFHESLNTYTPNNDNSSEVDNLLVLGAFTIDPTSTDFVVVPKFAAPQLIDDENTIMPQWAIAVIVIGVGGLLFIIVFGVSVLLNRQTVTKIKPTMPIYDEEIEKNIIHKNQAVAGRRSIDYPKDDLYNIETDWNDRTFDSTSNKMMVDGPYDSSRYNLYDSWKSEWNGYYYNASHASNRSPGYESTTNVSRHRPNYDTDF